MFLSRRYFHDIRLRKNFRRKFQNCKRKQRKKKKKNNNNVGTARIKRRGQEDLPFFFFSREIQLKLRCVCNGERKKVKKKEKREKEARLLSFLFLPFFFFFPWEIPREIHRHRVFMRETTARDVTVIYYAYPRIHTRRYSGCSKTPVYQCDGQTAAHIHATGARTRSCDNGQGWWAREDDFSRLETSRVASNLVDKNCCKKRISL